MSTSLQLALPILEVLYSCGTRTFQSLLEDNKLNKVLCLARVEIAHNLLFTELPLSEKERSLLRKEREFIRKIAANKSAKTLKIRRRKLGIVARNRNKLRTLLYPFLKGSLKEICLSRSST